MCVRWQPLPSSAFTVICVASGEIHTSTCSQTDHRPILWPRDQAQDEITDVLGASSTGTSRGKLPHPVPLTNWAWVPGYNSAQPALVPSCFRDSLDFHLWKEITSSHIKIMEMHLKSSVEWSLMKRKIQWSKRNSIRVHLVITIVKAGQSPEKSMQNGP